MWPIHTKEYYSAIKGKEILPPATIWLNSEDIVLSEISQSERTDTRRFYFCEEPRVMEITERLLEA